MGLFNLVGGLIKTAANIAVTPLAIADDVIHGGENASTERAIGNIAESVEEDFDEFLDIFNLD